MKPYEASALLMVLLVATSCVLTAQPCAAAAVFWPHYLLVSFYLFVANCVLISMVQMFVIPVVYALDIFSGEVSNRTIHLLFKIPVKRWMIFFSKYLVAAIGIFSIFLISGVLMELLAWGRETSALFLLKTNLLYGTAGLILFTWFCAFGCQSRSEAGSLGAMFAVFVGSGIAFLWAVLCEVALAAHLIPYSLTGISLSLLSHLYTGLVGAAHINVIGAMFLQSLVSVGVLGIACHRYISIRRYL